MKSAAKRKVLESLTMSGLPGLKEIPWGGHFCQFYRTQQDFGGIAAAFLQTGHDNNESCIWVSSATSAEAAKELHKSAPGLKNMLDKGLIKIESALDQTSGGGLIERLLRAEKQALGAGRRGLRVAGRPRFSKETRAAVMNLEHELNSALSSRRIVALCCYDMARCKPTEIFQIVGSHGFAIERQDGHWMIHHR